MISTLRGIIHKIRPEELIVDVNGVGYGVMTPVNVWDDLKEGEEAQLHISTYVREDRFSLFGFADEAGKILFEKFIDMSGIGPRHGLELSAVPKSMLMQAIGAQDPKLLQTVKGIGKKTAEKLLVDLKSLAEKQPEIFGSAEGATVTQSSYDQDAIDALKSLGYDTGTIMKVLQDLPEDLTTSEQRVAAALRSL